MANIQEEGNELEVGDALKALMKEPSFKREDIWITSKAWNSYVVVERQLLFPGLTA
jgi:diketogulonate reductase-like aldo/keto reductase